MSNAEAPWSVRGQHDGNSHLVVRRPRAIIHTAIFPILASIFAIASFVSGYAIAVGRNDAEPWFSYISDGGALVPESCVFGILLNFAAFFWLLTAAVRHIQLAQHYHVHNIHGVGWSIAKWVMTIAAVLSAIGLAGVANFQETAVAIVHGFSAWAAFFGGLTFVWVYIAVSLIARPRMVPIVMNIFRIVIAVIVTVSLAFHMIFTNSPILVKKTSLASVLLGLLFHRTV